jgi:hypothetical protein
MRESVKNRAAAIRDYLDRQDDLHADAATIYKYSVTAAQWDAMRLLIDRGKATSADDKRLAELGNLLKKLSEQIGLGGALTDPNGFLPRDPSRIIEKTWQDAAEGW